MKLSTKKSPLWAIQKASKLLTKWQSRGIRANRTRKFGYLKIRVTQQWRLLSKDGGNTWELVSHSTYNRSIDK